MIAKVSYRASTSFRDNSVGSGPNFGVPGSLIANDCWRYRRRARGRRIFLCFLIGVVGMALVAAGGREGWGMGGNGEGRYIDTYLKL